MVRRFRQAVNREEGTVNTETIQCQCDDPECPRVGRFNECSAKAVRVVVLKYLRQSPGGGSYEKTVRLAMCGPCADWWESTGRNLVNQGPEFGYRAPAVLRIGPGSGPMLPVVAAGGSGQ